MSVPRVDPVSFPEHGHICPYCLADCSTHCADVRERQACGKLYVWSPKTQYEIQGREAIRDLRKLREVSS